MSSVRWIGLLASGRRSRVFTLKESGRGVGVDAKKAWSRVHRPASRARENKRERETERERDRDRDRERERERERERGLKLCYMP